MKNAKGISRLFLPPLLAAAGAGLLLLPGGLRLPCYRRTSLDGVVTLADAAQRCRDSGLREWELVTFAQRLVARKFAIYSTLNLWDPPGRAFVHGMGYCAQYNLALKDLLARLGVPSRAVFARRVHVFDDEAWSMGHTWLRVTLGGETRDVCAGRVANTAGNVHFSPLTPVREGSGPLLALSHLGLILFCGVLEWKALLAGTEPPAWAYKERGA